MLLFVRKSVLPFSRRGFILFEFVITLAVLMTALFFVLSFFGNCGGRNGWKRFLPQIGRASCRERVSVRV